MTAIGDRGSTTAVDPNFVVLVRAWMSNPAEMLLGFVWSAYDVMRKDNPEIDTHDLERSITQLLEPRVRASMTGYEPFYVQHGPFERETMMPAPAQPPQYDLAFVLRANERVMWPLEAKVLEKAKAVARYVRDIEEQYLTCRYAPFSGSAAMLGYLLDGEATDAFAAIAHKLSCALDPVPGHANRNNRVSQHARCVPPSKAYPASFACYHLILDYVGLRRAQSPHA